MKDQEYSESGNPIYRYDNVKANDFTPPKGDGDNIETISNHIEQYIGNIESVYHELVSDMVHIDVHWVKPSNDFPFHTLVTSGMSDKPLTVPEGSAQGRFLELCILLPQEWNLGANGDEMQKAFEDEKNYWPVRWLKTIARFPHKYNTWLGHGHTIPNGENAEPFADGTKLGCMILMPSISLNPDFFKLKINEEKTIQFYCLYPLYKEEMDLKLKKGSDALIDKFEEYDIIDIIDVERVNTCA